MDLLDKMATYVRVVEAGSLSAAAKQLRISAAAVSRQIATLEAELGAELLVRTTRRMTVTPTGRGYYERCIGILRDVGAAQALGRSAVDGTIRISAPVTFGLACVVARLAELRVAHPSLLFDLRIEDRVIDLAVDGVDVAIRVGAAPPASADVIAHPLMTFERVVVAAPSYVKRRGEPRTPAALVKHTALTHAVDIDAWTLVGPDAVVRARISPAVRCNALHALRELAVAGAGITMLPSWFVTAELARNSLATMLPGWRSEPIPVHALHRTVHRGDRRIRALIDHLRAAYAA